MSLSEAREADVDLVIALDEENKAETVYYIDDGLSVNTYS